MASRQFTVLLVVLGLIVLAYNSLFIVSETQRAVQPAKQWGFAILLILLISPGLNQWFFSGVYWLFDLSGVPAALSSVGSQLTRFWSAWL